MIDGLTDDAPDRKWSPRRVLIVGAGAMGCLFGAKLALAGLEVTLVDVDQSRVAALREGGIRLTDDDGTRQVPVHAGLAAEISQDAELLLIFTKGLHTEGAAIAVRHLLAENGLVLTLQNGLGNGETLARVFGEDRVLVGTTDLPSDLEPPAHVSSHGSGSIRLGRLRSGPGTDRTSEAVAHTLARAGLSAEYDRDIQVAIWEKAAFNSALNTIAMVTGLAIGEFDQPSGRWIADQIVAEATASAHANGVEVSHDRIAARVRYAFRFHGAHAPSMLQDRLASRQTEIESISGAIIAAGERLGVQLPVMTTMAHLVRVLDTAAIRNAATLSTRA